MKIPELVDKFNRQIEKFNPVLRLDTKRSGNLGLRNPEGTGEVRALAFRQFRPDFVAIDAGGPDGSEGADRRRDAARICICELA